MSSNGTNSNGGLNPSLSQFEPRMAPNSPDKLNGKRTILLSISFFVVLLAWSYFNFKVPKILDVLLGDIVAKQTIKGVIMALDNFSAVLLQPFFGQLSDRTKSKFGRRMPYIVLGTCLSAVFFVVMPWVQFIAGFIIIVLLFDLSMSTFRAVSVAILPDYTLDTYRSKASSIQQFLSNIGGVIAFVVPIIVGIIPGLSLDMQTVVAFTIISAMMIIAIGIQTISIKETPTGTKLFEIAKREIVLDPLTLKVNEREISSKKEEINIYKKISQVFRAEEKSFAYMLMVVFFAYLAFAAVEAFFSSFAQFFMGKTDGVSGTLFLAYSVPMILTAYIWGIVGQKIGRKKAVKISLIGILIGSAIMTFITAPLVYDPPLTPGDLENTLGLSGYLVMINLAIMSMPWMCFIVNSFPIIWKLAPESEVGAYTGVYYTFNQLAYTISPIVLGISLDFFQFLGPQQYLVMFPFVMACIIISFVFMKKVKRGDAESSI